MAGDGLRAEQAIARRGLLIFLTLVLAGSAVLELQIVRSGETVDKVPRLIFALMYVPAVASFVTRLLLWEGFGDISLRSGGTEGRRTMLLAWIFPTLVGCAAYGAAWLTHLAEFQRPLPARSHLYVDSAAANFAVSLLAAATIGTAVSCVSAFGEEVGWRGYMLTRLIAAGVPRPVLASGVIWALWHVPLILSGQYAAGSYPRVSALIFVAGVVALGYLAAYVRLQSGSVWPAVVLHGAWNAIIQGTFDRATVGSALAVGESGWLTTSASIVFVILMTRGVWTLRRSPGETLSAPPGPTRTGSRTAG